MNTREKLSRKNLFNLYNNISSSTLKDQYYVHRIYINTMGDSHINLSLYLRDIDGNVCEAHFIKSVGFGECFIKRSFSRFKQPLDPDYMEDLTFYFDNFIENLFTLYPTTDISQIDFYPFSGAHEHVKYISVDATSYGINLGRDDLI